MTLPSPLHRQWLTRGLSKTVVNPRYLFKDITTKFKDMNAISNSVQLIGNLGRDVEFYQLDNGYALARVSIATKEIFRDKRGKRQSKTTWHQLIGWGKVAEMMQMILRKGSSVVIQGRINNELFGEGKSKQVKTEIVVSQFRLMG